MRFTIDLLGNELFEFRINEARISIVQRPPEQPRQAMGFIGDSDQ